jgi:hypothetical protein
MNTTVRLTEQSEKLLKEQLATRPDASPEEIIERALEFFARQHVHHVAPQAEQRKMTPAEAVAAMMELRKNQTLGGLKIKDLINEGRKY